MQEYDDAVLQCFLKHQLQLFPEAVAETAEEAEEFLTDCLAVVVSSAAEVEEFFEEEGIDIGDGFAQVRKNDPGKQCHIARRKTRTL